MVPRLDLSAKVLIGPAAVNGEGTGAADAKKSSNCAMGRLAVFAAK